MGATVAGCVSILSAHGRALKRPARTAKDEFIFVSILSAHGRALKRATARSWSDLATGFNTFGSR